MQFNSKYRIKNYLSERVIVYFAVCFLSFACFIAIYGFHILNPFYSDWLLSGGDLSQHYLGWKAFRNSTWYFPIGMLDTLAYPSKTSVIFTDSIPVFAVIFKLISPILPREFQYFGLWGGMCFVLQGVFATRILRAFCKGKPIYQVIGAMLVVVSPVMIYRMFAHTSLAGQWILIMALEPVLVYDKYRNTKKQFIWIAMTGFLAASIHIYFVIMCAFILLAYGIQLMMDKHYKEGILAVIIYLCVVGITIAILGGFSSKAQPSGDGLGAYSFNLNALFNPQGQSYLFKDKPLYVSQQYEGFAYMGAGCIFLLILALISLLSSNQCIFILKKYRFLILGLSATIVVALFVAVSPKVTYGNILLVEWRFPDLIMKLWSIVRSSGRIAWVIVYTLTLCSLVVLVRLMDERKTVVIISVCLVLQVWDLQNMLIVRNEKFNHVEVFASSIQDRFWKSLEEGGIKNIVSTKQVWDSDYISLANWALSNKYTLNRFYFSRIKSSEINNNLQNALENLSEENLYIFYESNKLECLNYPELYYYNIDGRIVGYIHKIEDFIPMKKEEFSYIWKFGENKYITENCGKDIAEGRILYSGGLSCGPCWQLPKGSFLVTISGSNIENNIQITTTIDQGENEVEHEIVEVSEDKISFLVKLVESVDDFEVRICNTFEKDIFLKDIVVMGYE